MRAYGIEITQKTITIVDTETAIGLVCRCRVVGVRLRARAHVSLISSPRETQYEDLEQWGNMTRERTKREPERGTLQETIQRILDESTPRTVSELYSAVLEKNPTTSRDEFAEVVKDFRDKGRILLEMPPPNVSSYRAYILLRDWNAWYLTAAAACVLTLISIYFIPSTFPYVALRWIAGSVFVLFIPGYVTVQALFPSSRDLDDIERFALSIGLSLAITPLIGLLLNYLPWGIRLSPIVVSLCTYSLGIGLAGTWRRYRSITQTQTSSTPP